MNTASNKTEEKTPPAEDTAKAVLTVRVVSFGYKLGKPPTANALFDVRFLKNPYWVDHLRPMTGKDLPVQEYVMNQKVATDFLNGLVDLLQLLIPQLQENAMTEFHIAFGCTGGQHRSATMVELLSKTLAERFPDIKVERVHRELDKTHAKLETQEDGK